MDEFFKKVESSQGFVAWTDSAFAMDSRYRNQTRFGYIFLIVIIVGVLALAGYTVYTLKNQS